MREALKLTVADDKQGGINDQVWYDSLRETDDGRFSQTQIFAHQSEYLKDKVQKRNDYLKRKILPSTFKSKSGSVANNTSDNIVISGEQTLGGGGSKNQAHSKSQNGIAIRPFNSQHRMNFRPLQSNKSGGLFVRNTALPNKDRTAGYSGQEISQMSRSPPRASDNLS